MSESDKMKIAGKQYFKCYNKDSCLLWQDINNPGSFDENGFEIDNEQALCPTCYQTKYEKIINVTTYIDYIKYSNLISIVVTNKKRKEGYLQFSDHTWHKFINIAINSTEEYLEGFLREQSWRCCYKYENKIISPEEQWKLSESKYECIEILMDYKSIVNDIYVKCCKRNFFYNPMYHEFLLYVKDKGAIIFNSKNCTFHDPNEISNGKIILPSYLGDGHITNYNTNADINIIDTFFSVYIPSKETLIKFKQLCQNILVNHNVKHYIFREYHDGKAYLITEWLYQLACHLNGNIIKSNHYNSFINLKKEIKSHKKYRCIILDEMVYDRYGMTEKILIENLVKIGIKNFIIRKISHVKNKYDEQKFKTLIQQYNNDKYIDHIELFEPKGILFINFLKWCVSE
jgi:hypothetical protein